MNCSNCETPASLQTALITYQGTKTEPVAVICDKCQETVATLKIVLSRRATQSFFVFEGYLPVSSVK